MYPEIQKDVEGFDVEVCSSQYHVLTCTNEMTWYGMIWHDESAIEWAFEARLTYDILASFQLPMMQYDAMFRVPVTGTRQSFVIPAFDFDFASITCSVKHVMSTCHVVVSSCLIVSRPDSPSSISCFVLFLCEDESLRGELKQLKQLLKQHKPCRKQLCQMQILLQMQLHM